MTTPPLARKLVVGLEGPRLTPREAGWIAAHRPAGVILFARNCTDARQTAELCASLHALAPELEIVADHEGGPVSALENAAGRPPAAFALGALDDADLTRRVCRQTAMRLRSLGVDRVLAPVADVLTEPANPVIGARSFGTAPELCARHVAAAVAGYGEAGLRSCLKHWPGHGGTWTDSHIEAARCAAEPPLEAFVAGMAAGADAVMAGHLIAPGGSAPASVDPAAVARLRASLPTASGDEPLVFADDITMGALRSHLAGRGIGAGDGLAEGLADPAGLSAAWLDGVGVCDRLPIRGIPWKAVPGGTELDPPSAEVAPAVLPRPAGDAWDEARHRLWRREVEPFLAGADLALLIDRTRGDRWEAAAGGQTGAEGLHAAAARLGIGLTDAAEGCDRVIVASHRPLPPDWRPSSPWPARGRALAVGHPSLASSLAAVLGPQWAVGALYDTHADDLAPPEPAPQKEF